MALTVSEAREAPAIYLAWSGGKDSALALWYLRQQGQFRISHLLTTVSTAYGRTTMHGVRRSLLRAQAARLGLPLVEVALPSPCPMETYSRIMGEAMQTARENGIFGVAYGDIFLEDVRAYRSARLAEAGLEGVFPLWGGDTRLLAHTFIDAGFRARAVCVDTEQLDASFVGRPYDGDLLADLPEHVDPCGENGEFHTFVSAGPIFSEGIGYITGHVEDRGRFVYQELLPV